MTPEPLLTAKQVAVILGVHFKEVYGLGIPEYRLSRKRVRYHPKDVQAWIDQHKVEAA